LVAPVQGIKYVLCLSVLQKAVLPPGTDVMSPRQHLNTPGGNTAYAVPVVTPLAASDVVYAVMTCEW